MTITAASKIKLDKYTRLPDFETICNETEKSGLCSPHHIRGSDVDICLLVKKADIYNEYARKQWETPTLSFVLKFVCTKIPYQLFKDAAKEVYNTHHPTHEEVDETYAMAVVLMITFGYEIRKLWLVRSRVYAQNQKVESTSESANNAVVSRLALPGEYESYHLDMIDEQNDKIIRGYQFERSEQYFKCLNEPGKSTEFITEADARRLEPNRVCSRNFLKAYSGVLLEQYICSLQPGKFNVQPFNILRRGSKKKIAQQQ